jgi:hypothetical protein
MTYISAFLLIFIMHAYLIVVTNVRIIQNCEGKGNTS